MTLPSAPKPTLHDEMMAFLREHAEGVSASVLAAKFLKLKNAPPRITDGAIQAILADDHRVFAGEDGLWRAAPAGTGNEETLRSLPWIAVYCVTDPLSRRVLHFSAWDLYPAPLCTYAAWLADPKFLSPDEGELLQGGADVPFDADRSFARDAAARIAIFLSSNHRELLESVCAEKGEILSDDTMLVRELLKAAGCEVPRSLDLAQCEKAVLGAEQPGGSALKQGERFAIVLYELFELLKRKGIETRTAFDRCLSGEKAPLFIGKKFSYDDILALPPLPGVYAFKDINGKHCYIGKAVNLKRRLQSYWKDSDESPGKLLKLREVAHSFVTHRCGSELECLLYEYRLIRKYAPPLNKQVDVFERKGTFRPVDDCIVLLPHAETGKGMSVWFRGNQKILLKPFDVSFQEKDVFIAELAAFFFSPVLPAGPADFPEQEIATRWIKRHADALAMLPVNRMANAEEIHNALKSLWRDYSESLKAPTGQRETQIP